MTADDWTILLAATLTATGTGALIYATINWWKWRNQ
jgi:hypothetical protein